MKIYYAEKLLGDDSPMRDIGSGFLPGGGCAVQWIAPLRAADARPVARGNRQRTVTLRLSFAPSGGALARLSDFFDELPDDGMLRWEENGFVREAAAVLQDYRPADRKGCTGVVDVTFALARPVKLADGDWNVPGGSTPPDGGGSNPPAYDIWTDETGEPLTDETGEPLYFANED